jgi:hypothetical protein
MKTFFWSIKYARGKDGEHCITIVGAVHAESMEAAEKILDDECFFNNSSFSFEISEVTDGLATKVITLKRGEK